MIFEKVDLIDVEKTRFARASSPGSNVFVPSLRARSISIVPQTRSSVAPAKIDDSHGSSLPLEFQS